MVVESPGEWDRCDDVLEFRWPRGGRLGCGLAGASSPAMVVDNGCWYCGTSLGGTLSLIAHAILPMGGMQCDLATMRWWIEDALVMTAWRDRMRRPSKRQIRRSGVARRTTRQMVIIRVKHNLRVKFTTVYQTRVNAHVCIVWLQSSTLLASITHAPFSTDSVSCHLLRQPG